MIVLLVFLFLASAIGAIVFFLLGIYQTIRKNKIKAKRNWLGLATSFILFFVSMVAIAHSDISTSDSSNEVTVRNNADTANTQVSSVDVIDIPASPSTDIQNDKISPVMDESEDQQEAKSPNVSADAPTNQTTDQVFEQLTTDSSIDSDNSYENIQEPSDNDRSISNDTSGSDDIAYDETDVVSEYEPVDQTCEYVLNTNTHNFITPPVLPLLT